LTAGCGSGDGSAVAVMAAAVMAVAAAVMDPVAWRIRYRRRGRQNSGMPTMEGHQCRCSFRHGDRSCGCAGRVDVDEREIFLARRPQSLTQPNHEVGLSSHGEARSRYSIIRFCRSTVSSVDVPAFWTVSTDWRARNLHLGNADCIINDCIAG